MATKKQVDHLETDVTVRTRLGVKKYGGETVIPEYYC